MGSDYPFPLGELVPGQLIESMDFDKETKDWLLYKSALDWLKLPREKYLKLGLADQWPGFLRKSAS
jgi:aminocarboxymuconate-semialdehyde decarboxylase